MAPKQEELDDIASTINKLAVVSDVLVFDWSLGEGDAGLHTRKFITNLVHNDKDNRDRLRLIVIYTIDSRILDILRDIEREIQSLPESPAVVKNEAEYSLRIASTKIVILLKQQAQVPQENAELQNRKIPFNELANRIIYEFTEMTCGLIPNIALKSMAEIRKNTSKILRFFNDRLDAPYLAHRTLLEDPDDAEAHIVELISADLSAILEEVNVKQCINMEWLNEWLNFREALRPGFPLTNSKGTVIQLTKQQITKMLKDGILKSDLKLTEKEKRDPQKLILSQVFSGDLDRGVEAEEEFAHLTAFRTFFGNHIPKLNLGTVIKTDEDAKYLVCIQPRCDCVRINSVTCFNFLPLEVRSENETFDLIIKDKGKYIRTRTKKKVASITQIKFKGDGSGIVPAIMDAADFYFISEPQKEGEPPKRYKWIGELRLERAISLSSNFAAELARVGFTESEWLRLYAKKQ